MYRLHRLRNLCKLSTSSHRDRLQMAPNAAMIQPQRPISDTKQFNNMLAMNPRSGLMMVMTVDNIGHRNGDQS